MFLLHYLPAKATLLIDGTLAHVAPLACDIFFFFKSSRLNESLLFIFLKIFLVWIIFKVFIEFVIILLLFYVLVFWL